MLNKKIMILALILVSLLTISCVSAAEDGNDVLNTISVDGIDDEQAVEASVDDAEFGAAEENSNLQLSPEDFNVTFYGDTFEVESTANLLRFYWPDEVPVGDNLVINVSGEWGYPHNIFKHDGETFVDVPFNEMYIFDPEIINITVSYGDMELASKTITVIKKFTPNNFLEIYSKDISNSSDYIANVYDSYNNGKGLEGNVTLTADGVLVYSEVFTGTGLIQKFITTDDLTTTLSGTKFVVVTYQRAANGNSYTKNANINFVSGEPTGPANTTLYLWYTANKFILEAYLIDDEHNQVIANAPIVINLDGVDYDLVTGSDGFAKLSTTFLEPGSYNVTASYAGSDTYKPSSASTSFVFARTDTHIDFDYYEYGKTLYITLVDNTNWPVKYADLVINFNGNTYNRKADVYGCVEFKVGDLASGTYPVNVSYAGNATYNPSNASYDIIVGGGDSIIYCDYYEDARELAITLTDPYAQAIVGADVLVNLAGVDYNLVTDYSGMATLSLPDLAPGPYTANISYAGSYDYGPAFASYDFNVPKIDTDMSLVYSNDELVATLLNNVTGKPIKGASVIFKFNDVSATVKTDANGQAKYYYVEGGSYTATASYKGNSKYNPSTASVEFTIKISTSLFLAYNNGAREVVATLINDATGQAIKNANIRFEVNGVKSTVKSDANGQAKVSVSSLDMGTYSASASYNGNTKYYPVNRDIDFTVTKVLTTVSMYYDNATNELVATLVNSETGKPISSATVVFNFNGVKTGVKTDKQGQARFSIGDVDPNGLSAGISYGGNSKYLRSSGSIKIATGKVATTISNFYDKETQEVVATLINRETGLPIKGATVVFNFNKVKTSLKTDKFGQVSMSVGDLNPNEYTIGTSYGGNSKYAGSTASTNFVKI